MKKRQKKLEELTGPLSEADKVLLRQAVREGVREGAREALGPISPAFESSAGTKHIVPRFLGWLCGGRQPKP